MSIPQFWQNLLLIDSESFQCDRLNMVASMASMAKAAGCTANVLQ